MVQFATANVRNRPDLPRAAVKKCGQMAMGLGFVGFQEIGEAEDHVDIKAGMGAGHGWLFDNLPIPIAYDNRNFGLIHETHFKGIPTTGWHQTHKGSRAASTPPRYFAWGIFHHLHRPHLPPFMVVNTHMVQTGHKVGARQWRMEHWHMHWDQQRAFCLNANHHGLTVFLTGDWNNPHVPRFVGKQRWLMEAGIDKIGMIPGSVGFNLHEQRHLNTPSDHDLRWVDGVLFSHLR